LAILVVVMPLRADSNLKAETPAADWWTARSLAMMIATSSRDDAVSCEIKAIKPLEQTGFRLLKNRDDSRPATMLASGRST
jgi:hypothetical protein